MSQLMIKQKVFALTDKYDIYDAAGNAKYYVKSDFISIGRKIHVFDKATGQEIGLIKGKVFTLLHQFEIHINGQYMGMIKRKFSVLKPKYEIDYKGWRLEGDYLQWNYDIYEQNRHVVHIHKKFLTWGDTYILDIANDMDEIPALMVAIAIDAAREDDQNAATAASSSH